MRQPATFTIRQFLESGNLGPLNFGMTKDEVKAVIGDNGNDLPRVPGQRPPKRRPWQYGPLYLSFRRRKLMYMGFHFSQLPALGSPLFPPPLRVDGYFPSEQTKLAEFDMNLIEPGRRASVPSSDLQSM